MKFRNIVGYQRTGRQKKSMRKCRYEKRQAKLNGRTPKIIFKPGKIATTIHESKKRSFLAKINPFRRKQYTR